VNRFFISRHVSSGHTGFGLVLFSLIGLLLLPVKSFAQGPLTNGGNNAGSISVAGEIDQWTFTANLGDAILLKIGETGGNSTFIPWIRLLDPNGVQLGSAAGVLAAEIQVRAALSGTYTVLARDGTGGGNATGNYVLHLVKTPGVLSVGDEGGPMTNGANHTGVIDVGDIDAWTFQAAQNDAIVLKIGEMRVGEVDPGFVPWIRLFDPNGLQLGSAAGVLAAEIQVRAALSGSYTVVVTDGNGGGGAATGNYVLRLVKTPGAVVVPVNDEGGPLTNGGEHAGVIDVGDLDPWTFQAAQNDAIVLKIGEKRIGEVDPGFVPWIRLFGPDGVQLGSAAGVLAAEMQVRAPLSGSYTVVVTDGNGGGGAATGNYVLRLVKTPGAVVVTDGDQGGPLTNGANHPGVITVGDVDPWTFQAAQNDAILLKIGEVITGEVDPGFVPWIRLFGPDGAQLGSAAGVLAAEIQVSAPLSGSYTVVVTDGNGGGGAATGNYLLRLVKTPGAFVVPVGDDGGGLTSGVARPGVIDVGDLDPFTFNTVQGGAITVSIGEVITGEIDPGFVPWIRLFSPTGVQVGSAAGALTAQINVSAPLSGTYTVVVADGNGGGGAAHGNYNLTAVYPQQPTLPVIVTQPSNQSVPAGGNAAFSVTATGTALTYQWQVSSNGGVSWTNVSNTLPYGGATTAALAVTNATVALNGLRYRCVVSNGAGSVQSNAAILTVSAPTKHPPTDFDGDRKAEIVIYRPPTSEWFILNSSSGSLRTAVWGANALGDIPVPADYDGDGKADIAVYRKSTGEWFILNSASNTFSTVVWGSGGLGDIPVPSDYDGDGRADIAVYRTSTGEWFIRNSGNNSLTAISWGSPNLGDVPVPADYNGDGKTDIAVYRGSGDWFILNSGTGTLTTLKWGAPGLGDVPVPADYDGDSRADIAVFRGSTGEWFILNSGNGSLTAASWGAPSLGDVPVPTDFDGDGRADIAIYRKTSGEWFINNSSAGGKMTVWGSPAFGDIPVVLR
jgi:FG-GAP-like repeat